VSARIAWLHIELSGFDAGFSDAERAIQQAVLHLDSENIGFRAAFGGVELPESALAPGSRKTRESDLDLPATFSRMLTER
jgi:hypothetical protein